MSRFKMTPVHKFTGNSSILVFYVLVSSFLNCVHCQTMDEVKNLHTDLLSEYNKDVRPVTNQASPINVSVSLYLRSIQELNELTEEFYFTGAFALTWTDSGITWNPAKYGNTYKTYISYESVWVPEIILTTTSDNSDTMAKKWQRVKYYFTGLAEIVVGGRVKATCGVDVQKYPFDKQTCTLVFQAWGYEAADLLLQVSSETAHVHQYTKNGQWDLDGTHLNSTVIDNWSTLEVSFYLSRKAGFAVISLVAPLIFLSVLNLFVFILTPESGERVSYSITVLLAIAVFMTIISDALPSSSEPVPTITYLLMVELIVSVSITLITIFNLGIYHKDDAKPIPKLLKSFYVCICCRKTDKNVVFVAEIDNKINVKHANRNSDFKKPANHVNVTWKDISAMLDYIALVVFTLATILAFVVYIAIVIS